VFEALENAPALHDLDIRVLPAYAMLAAAAAPVRRSAMTFAPSTSATI